MKVIKRITALLTAMTMTMGAMSVTAYAEGNEQSIYIYSDDIDAMPQTADESFIADDIDNPAYIAYVKTLTAFPHEKELIELIDSNIKHMYKAPHFFTIEFEEEDGTRIFKDCSSIWFDWVIDKSGIKNGHSVEEANEYLNEIGSKQYYEYVTHPNGESVYSLYNWGTDNGMDGDSEDIIMEVWIKLCQKFGFEVGWNESIYGSDHFPKFQPSEDYGTYLALDPARYGTEEGKVEVKLYEDGRTEYPSGAVQYADETIKYPEGYDPPDEKMKLMTIPKPTDIQTTSTTTVTTISVTATPETSTGTDQPSISTKTIVGDANGDSKLNVRDCAFIANALANGKADSLPDTADYNKDGKKNVRDAAAISKDLASK